MVVEHRFTPIHKKQSIHISEEEQAEEKCYSSHPSGKKQRRKNHISKSQTVSALNLGFFVSSAKLTDAEICKKNKPQPENNHLQ